MSAAREWEHQGRRVIGPGAQGIPPQKRGVGLDVPAAPGACIDPQPERVLGQGKGPKTSPKPVVAGLRHLERDQVPADRVHRCGAVGAGWRQHQLAAAGARKQPSADRLADQTRFSLPANDGRTCREAVQRHSYMIRKGPSPCGSSATIEAGLR